MPRLDRLPPPLWVALAAVAVSLNGLAGAPVLDDGWVIFQNPLVTSLSLERILREGYNAGGPVTTAGLFRPVTTLSYALTYAVAGHLAWPYHLVNVVLHAGVSVLVHALAMRVVSAFAPARARTAALLAGLLFAVHPVHADAVAALVGRAELLAAAGALGALLLALGRGAGEWRLPAAAAAGTLGVLSKENAAVLPALFLLVAIAAPAAAGLPARPGLAPGAPRRALGRAVLVAATLTVPVAVYLLVRPHGGAGVPASSAWFAGQPREVVLGTMSRALSEYWRLLAVPHPLGLDFFYAQRIPAVGFWSAPALLSFALWGTLLGLGLASSRRAPARFVGILWVFAALAPVSNVLVPTGVLMAERLLYLPSAGFCLWLGHGLAWAAAALERRRAERSPRRWADPRLARAAAALLLVAWSARTVARNADWRRPRTLWEAELEKAPRDPVVNNNLAVELNGAGEHARAVALLETALRVAPRYWRAHVNLGIARQRTGDPAGALRAFEEASRIAPGEASPHFYRGLFLLERGVHAEALAALRRAVALGPEDPWARVALGRALERSGRRAEARAEYAAALRIDPRNAEARRALQVLDDVREEAP